MTLTAHLQGTCEACGKTFQRFSSFQRVCRTPRCANRIVKADKQREAQETRARRLALKPRAKWIAEAQAAVNAYVRARDQGKPCISCSTPWHESFQAGHYLTRGARPELRFHLDNIHGQCIQCNLHLHGNQAMARIGILARIGLERVEALEGPRPLEKFPVDELRCIRDGYRAMTKQLLEDRDVL